MLVPESQKLGGPVPMVVAPMGEIVLDIGLNAAEHLTMNFDC